MRRQEGEKAGLVSQFQQGDCLCTFEHGRNFGNDLAAFSREEPAVPVIAGLPL